MSSRPVLDRTRRGLTARERRLIRARIGSLARRTRRASRAALPATGAVVLLLWLLTLLVSDSSWVVVTAFWVAVGALLAWWVRRDMRRHGGQFDTMARDLESALRRGEADVYEVSARAFVEVAEIEDEGACYAFDLDGARIVFVTGQEFYASAKFPSLDFSLVYVLDEQSRTVDMIIDKRGAKATPIRTISAASKRALDVPGHLEVLVGRLDDLEHLLTPSRIV